MVMPNFLIIGAAKAGTTSLYSYLEQHPQIYMSPSKEPRFFALEDETPSFGGINHHNINNSSVTDLETYSQLFKGVTDEVAVGEASTIYIYNEKAPLRIKHHIPNAKLVAVLRDPCERAFSSYMHLVRDGFETLEFVEGLKAEEKRIQENWQPLWFYKDRGFYYKQLIRYYDLFDAKQIKVYLYEDLLADSTKVIQDLYDFLGVDSSFLPNLDRANVSGIPKKRWLQSLFMKDNLLKSTIKPFLSSNIRRKISKGVQKRNLGAKPTMPRDIRQDLVAHYKDDVLKLQKLINRDLSDWLR